MACLTTSKAAETVFGDLDCCLAFSVERNYEFRDCLGNITSFSYTILP